MKFSSFRELKDHTRQSEPKEPKEPSNAGLLRNADPAVGERIYRQRDAMAVSGGYANESMDRPGRLGVKRGEGGLAFGNERGELKSGPAWREGLRARTPVQNNPSGKSDQNDVDRPRPVTR
jgi:hypothetical protein